jgi:hypothetical protein
MRFLPLFLDMKTGKLRRLRGGGTAANSIHRETAA